MKVCTDSCMLGAWTSLKMKDAQKVLDIGAGTGLLSLLLAQKTNARIDAIEYDADAFEQAMTNIDQSPWRGRIQMIHGDVRNLKTEPGYDFIISNPPFYASDLRSPEQKINNARHGDLLSMEALIISIQNNLKENGAFSILLPFHRTEYFERLAHDYGYFLQEKLILRQTPANKPFRSIVLFSSKTLKETVQSEMIIKDEKGKYTMAFIDLMDDFYESKALGILG